MLACRKDNFSYTCYVLGLFFCYRSVATHRGHIKKIKFGPGRGNNKLAVLFSDGIDIWDIQKVSANHCKIMLHDLKIIFLRAGTKMK